MSRWHVTAIAAGLLGMAAAATAHRGHDAISVVTFGDGRVTVSHRFEAHDIEPALARIAPAAQPSLDDPDAVAALEAYLGRRFALAVNGRPVPLAHVRTDTASAEVRVEFAGKAAAKPKTVAVRSSILANVYPGQVHQVNVRAGGTVRTAQLRDGTAATLRFE